jgi:hypothetical protein
MTITTHRKSRDLSALRVAIPERNCSVWLPDPVDDHFQSRFGAPPFAKSKARSADDLERQEISAELCARRTLLFVVLHELAYTPKLCLSLLLVGTAGGTRLELGKLMLRPIENPALLGVGALVNLRLCEKELLLEHRAGIVDRSADDAVRSPEL